MNLFAHFTLIFAALAVQIDAMAGDNLSRRGPRVVQQAHISNEHMCSAGIVSKQITIDDVKTAHKELAARPSKFDGVEGFFGPESMLWKLNRYRSLSGWAAFVAMVRNPDIRAAGLEIERGDIGERKKRTSALVGPLFFGNRKDSISAAKAIHLRHSELGGVLGEPNPALKSDNVFWVLATLFRYQVINYEKYVARLTVSEKDGSLEDLKTAAMLMGIKTQNFPTRWQQFEDFFKCQLKATQFVEFPEEWLDLFSDYVTKAPYFGLLVQRACGSAKIFFVTLLAEVGRDLNFTTRTQPSPECAAYINSSMFLESSLEVVSKLWFPNHYDVGMKRVRSYQLRNTDENFQPILGH